MITRFTATNLARLGALMAGCIVLPSARAQSVKSGAGIGASQSLSQPAPQSSPSDTFPNVQHLFGDWGGIRTDLGDMGIDALFDYTSETAGNVNGGTRRALDYADQRALEVDIDWQKLAGITGLATHVVVVNRAGNNTSTAFGNTSIRA